MRDNTTLIILTRNCEKKIEGMISLLSTYCKKYHNIQEVIIGDNASEDETPKNLEAPDSTNSKGKSRSYAKQTYSYSTGLIRKA